MAKTNIEIWKKFAKLNCFVHSPNLTKSSLAFEYHKWLYFIWILVSLLCKITFDQFYDLLRPWSIMVKALTDTILALFFIDSPKSICTQKRVIVKIKILLGCQNKVSIKTNHIYHLASLQMNSRRNKSSYWKTLFHLG